MIALIILAVATPAAVAPKPDPLDKVVCHQEETVGSLLPGRKVCHTRREWRQINDNAQEEGRRITRPGAPTINN